MARGYYTSKISENLEETPEGYLIARNVPIARTGPQDYKVGDLPQDTARALGLDTSNPSASITVFRPAEEVFHPDTLKSFEGKPLTKNHPDDFVDPHSYREVAMGHVQNVRKGSEQLDGNDDGAGEWPMVADIIVTAEPLLSLVKNGSMRELSCGYDFGIKRNDDNPKLIDQCAIVGNHVAVVPHGRAGSSVRIVDAMPEPQVFAPPALVDVAPTYPPVAINFTTNKETHVSVKHKMLRLLMGKQLIEMARATDADPEKILDAAEELTKPDEPVEDKKVKDADPDKGDLIGTTPNKMNDKGKAKDAGPNTFESEGNDRRKAMHDALDEMMNKRDEKKAADKKGKDSDVAELKDLLDQFLSEEQKEPEHAADKDEPADPSELDSVLGGKDADEEECPECGEVGDKCECEGGEDSESEPGEEEGAAGEENIGDADPAINAKPDYDHGPGDKAKAKDAALVRGDRARANDAVAAALKMLRPSIAKCNDKAVHSAFNAALGSLTRSSKPTTGGYGAFAGSARARDKAPRNPNPAPGSARANDAQDAITKMQKFYDDARKGGK